jgi:hypothetical protein
MVAAPLKWMHPRRAKSLCHYVELAGVFIGPTFFKTWVYVRMGQVPISHYLTLKLITKYVSFGLKFLLPRVIDLCSRLIEISFVSAICLTVCRYGFVVS